MKKVVRLDQATFTKLRVAVLDAKNRDATSNSSLIGLAQIGVWPSVDVTEVDVVVDKAATGRPYLENPSATHCE